MDIENQSLFLQAKDKRKPMKFDEEADYVPVQIGSIPLDSILSFNLYIQKNNGYALYREKNLEFTAETKSRLIANKVDCLYIMQTDTQRYLDFIESNLSTIVSDPNTSVDFKSKAVYECASKVVFDVLQQPDVGENLVRAVGVAQNLVDFLMQGREPFFKLLTRATRDYYTYNHSVHTCTYAVVLAKKAGYSMTNRTMLDDLATGILIHDIGKSRVPEEIINKPGPLTPEEWVEIRKHPQHGLDMARNISAVRPLSYIPILQHHEKLDGSGYPNGLHDKDIHIFGKIAAIVDVFDAMTTKRSYAPAKSYFDTLKEMLTMADRHLDKKLLLEFIKLLTGR